MRRMTRFFQIVANELMKGSCFWRKDDDSENTHLRIIISDSDPDGMVLLVGISSIKTGREDTSCILEAGDHKCIKHRSYIRYDKAIEINQKKLLSEKFKGLLIFKENFNAPLLLRIQNGAKSSLALPGKFRKYFDYFCLL